MSSDVGQWALQGGTTGLTMVPPAGHQQGDRHVLWAINKLEDKVPAISGLTPIAAGVVGTGAQAVDNGPQRITVWEFDEGASLTSVAITIASALNSLGGGYGVRPGAGQVFIPSTVLFASDIVSDLSFSAVMPSNQGFSLGDWAVQVATFTHGNPGLPGRSFTIPGCTLTGAGGVPLNSSPQNSTGNHQYTFTDRGQVTAGAQSAAATAGATTTTATTGGAAHIRLRTRVSTAINPATEAEEAEPVGRRRQRAAGATAEAEAAQVLGRRRQRAAGLATEAEAAVPFGRRRNRLVAFVTELDLPGAVGRFRSRILGPAFEADEAEPVVRRRRQTIGITVELDEALPIVGGSTALPRDLDLVSEIEPGRWRAEIEPGRYRMEVER